MDLFSKDYTFVPIHDNMHWSLVLICHPGNVVQQEEDYGQPGDRVYGSPLLLHLDSMVGKSSVTSTLVLCCVAYVVFGKMLIRIGGSNAGLLWAVAPLGDRNP